MMASTTKIIVIRFIFGIPFLIAGLFFLYKSSLSRMQFGKAETVKIIAFVSLSPLFLLLLFVASKFIPILETHLRLTGKEAIVNSVLFAVICLLMFWIKNPGFGIHYSQHKNNPCVSQQLKTLSRGSAYNLFALVTFSFLPLIVAWKRKQTIELGYFSILLGLTMENSMEIQGTYGPNFWYILVAAFCCIGLIFSRGFLNSLIERRNNFHSGAQSRRSGFFFENCLASLLIAVGTFLLSKGSFFQDQFAGIKKWAGVFFLIMFAFLLLLLVVKAPTAIKMVADACRRNYVVKTIFNCCLLAFVSGVNFLKKYPKFKMQSTIEQSCLQQQNGNVISFGSHKFDLYSAGLFALFSLIVASARQQALEFGISSFLLELTMDASIEMFGNDQRPKFGYLLCASFYCVSLIFMRSYHDRILNLSSQGDSDLAAASENIHLREGEREQERESGENAEESNRIVHNAEERPVERKLSQTDERNQNGNSGNLLAWASRFDEDKHKMEGLRKRKTTTSQSIISESKPELKKGHDNEDEFVGKQRLERKKLDGEEDDGSYQVPNNGQIIPEERAEEREDRKGESSPVESELTQKEQECEIGESYNLGAAKHWQNFFFAPETRGKDKQHFREETKFPKLPSLGPWYTDLFRQQFKPLELRFKQLELRLEQLVRISWLGGISKVAKSFSREDDKSLRKLKSALRPSFSEFQELCRRDKNRWLQDIRTGDYSIYAEVPKSLRQPRKRDCFRGKHLMGKKSLGKNIWNRRAFDGKRKGR